jgi:glycerol kinase
LAGLAVGYWKNKADIQKNWQEAARFQPKMKPKQRETLTQGWIRALERSVGWEQS